MNVDKMWLREAERIAKASNDPSTKTGALIVDGMTNVAEGFNRFPKGIAETEELMNDRPAKYARVLHSECNAIFDAKGLDLTGCTIYIHPFLSCTNCAAMIIEQGIKRVVAPKTPAHLEERWGDSFVTARAMYAEAGVKVDEIELDI